eukprot:jgi/Ulvmu1/7313/UM035_0102.1
MSDLPDMLFLAHIQGCWAPHAMQETPLAHQICAMDHVFHAQCEVMQVCDEPTILLIDTPGIMLPRLRESVFAYRVALAGLVQETQVSLSELFAFTLYVLSQHPNKGQLKFVLSRPLPSEEGAQPGRSNAGVAASSHLHRSPQGELRHAYASKRLAKCILQGVNEAFEAMLAHSESSPDDQAVTQLQAPRTDAESGRNVIKKLRTRPADSRPRYAHQYLNLMGSTQDLQVSGAQDSAFGGDCDHWGDVAEPYVPTSGQKSLSNTVHVSSANVPERNHSSRHAEQPRQRAPRSWLPYNSQVWAVCADRVLSKLLKVDNPTNKTKLQEEQVTSSMERIIRMARSGDFGPLIFEQPATKHTLAA